jgi:hypothetical protein
LWQMMIQPCGRGGLRPCAAVGCGWWARPPTGLAALGDRAHADRA